MTSRPVQNLTFLAYIHFRAPQVTLRGQKLSKLWKPNEMHGCVHLSVRLIPGAPTSLGPSMTMIPSCLDLRTACLMSWDRSRCASLPGNLRTLSHESGWCCIPDFKRLHNKLEQTKKRTWRSGASEILQEAYIGEAIRTGWATSQLHAKVHLKVQVLLVECKVSCKNLCTEAPFFHEFRALSPCSLQSFAELRCWGNGTTWRLRDLESQKITLAIMIIRADTLLALDTYGLDTYLSQLFG